MLRKLLISLALLPLPVLAVEIEPIFSLHSLSYSEASAVYQMAKDRWNDAPSKKGKQAFTRNRLNNGVRIAWFSLAYHERKDLAFEFTPDTAELVYYKKQKLAVPEGRHYNLKLKARQLSAQGLRVGLHSPEWKNLQLTSYIYALKGTEIQQGRIEGVFAEEEGDKSALGYYGEGEINYIYHKDKLLKHAIGRPSGEGYAVDVHLNWQYQNYKLHAFVEDAWLAMKWRKAGFTNGTLSSDNKSFDNQGHVKYKALLSGRRGYNDIKQKNVSRYSGLEGSYQWRNWQFSNKVNHYAGLYFPALGVNWLLAGQHSLLAEYEFKSNKLTAGYFWQPNNKGKIGLSLGSDKTHLRYAKALELSMLASYTF